MAGARRPARALLGLGVLLVCCVPQSRQQGTGKGGYTGYDGFWVWDEEQDARLGGFGRQDVAARLVELTPPEQLPVRRLRPLRPRHRSL